MKTAISLPDDLFASADALAGRLGLSRSALIAAALSEYIAKHRPAKVTERLNAAYAAEDNRLDPGVRSAQRRAVTRSNDW